MSSITIQPDETSGVDTMINQALATTNYETDGGLQMGDDNTDTTMMRTLIKFDLSSIPPGSTINSAVLTLTYSEAGSFRASNNRTARVYRVLRAWVESQATWNIFATSNNWGTAGCSNTTTDREATDIGTASLATTDADESEKSWTLTASSVQEMLVGGTFTNNGFLIKVDTETNDRYFFRSSSAADSAKRPKLVVDFTAPATTVMIF